MSSDVDAGAWLEAGCQALNLGRVRQALRAFERAGAAGADRERLLALRAYAARALLAGGEILDAVELAAAILAEAPHEPVALEVMSEGARVGWIREALAALEARIRAGVAEACRAAAQTYEWLREDERALEHASRADRFETWLVRARVCARLGRADEARDALARAEGLVIPSVVEGPGREGGSLIVPPPPPGPSTTLGMTVCVTGLAEVAHAALLTCAFDRAEALFARIGDAPARAWCAELALWRMELDRAVELARSAPESARAHSVLGGACVLRGEYENALIHLDRALAMRGDDSEPTARHWRAEALRRLGRRSEALEEIDLAIAQSERFFVSAMALRQALAAGKDRAHAMSGGNRSDLPTGIDGGMSLDARTAARYHQESIRTRPADEVLAGFDALFARYGELPTIHCHRGELQLWLGRYDDAARSFERALELERATRWAWIGLGAARMFAGDDGEACRTFERGVMHASPPGRTMYVYRGELAFRRGRLDDAARDLELALRMNPERLAATLLLARVDEARADVHKYRARVERAAAAAPSLMRDASCNPRVALEMMRGNRSSTFVTYFTVGGAMRFVPPPRIEAVRLGLEPSYVEQAVSSSVSASPVETDGRS